MVSKYGTDDARRLEAACPAAASCEPTATFSINSTNKKPQAQTTARPRKIGTPFNVGKPVESVRQHMDETRPEKHPRGECVAPREPAPWVVRARKADRCDPARQARQKDRHESYRF